MQKPPVPQYLLLSNSITESSWAAPSESEGVQEGPGTEAIGFYFAFFGCKICFQRSWAFFIHPDPLPVLHTNELVELGHAQAEAATGKSESVPELQQSRAACWAPCRCPGLAPSQSCHGNPPQGQARPACVGMNPGCAGCGCSWSGWRVLDGSHTSPLVLHMLCRTMPCLGNCIFVSVLAHLCFTPSAFVPCRELAGDAGGSCLAGRAVGMWWLREGGT